MLLLRVITRTLIEPETLSQIHRPPVPLVAEHHLTLNNQEHPDHDPHFANEEMLLRVVK